MGLLTDLTITLIERLQEELGISTTLIRASELNVSGKGTALLCAISAELGATSYLSGPTGRSYLDLSVFAARGIGVEFHEFTHPTYPQTPGEFVSGLSVIDLLANVGADSLAVLQGSC